MKKLIYGFLIASIVIFPSCGSASYLGDFLRAGINPSVDPISFDYTGITFEGSTVDGNETTLSFTDPTSDVTITIPATTGNLLLDTNLGSAVLDSTLIFEGSTDDGNETTISVVDPTSDRTFYVPNYSGAAVLSTDSSNVPEGANSTWGATDSFIFEGATADDFETSISPVDPTADRTITLPDSDQTVGTATTIADNATLSGSLEYNSSSQTTVGPTDDLDVSDINLLQIDTSSNNVTIGGFTGGKSGQVLFITVTDATNNATLEHNEATGNQDIFLSSGSDETRTTSYGGWTLGCNGTAWFEVGN